MSKHTPGPWHVGNKYPADVYAARAGHAIARAVNPQCDGECEANARLIAAAPELLEALNLAVKLLRENIDIADNAETCRFDLTDWKLAAPIFAAIAKATGVQA